MDADVLRILDANVNRAREALRVIEDYARFALDDADAAAAAKRDRHALRDLAAAVAGAATAAQGEPRAWSDPLLAARDIEGDIGRDAKTTAELARGSAEDVVRAAFARLSEATRSLGEFGKLVPSLAGDDRTAVAAGPAQLAEELRYRGYELEQRIALRGTLRRRFREVRVYVLITAAQCRRPWLEVAETAIRGGAGCVQLREKELDDGELLRRARQLCELTTKRGVLLAINDRPDIARLARADIVHVGQDDLPVREVRRIAGGAVLVGKSTHTLAQFEAALAEEPDYVAVGPMFASGTKPQEHIAGPATVAAARGKTKVPLVAIGGITPDNAAEVVASGADCMAVCAAVSGANDPAGAVARLATLFRAGGG